MGPRIKAGVPRIYHEDIRAAEKIEVSRWIAETPVNGKSTGIAGCTKTAKDLPMVPAIRSCLQISLISAIH
jgi:hypothetical protein